jgi:hypothetical protein
MTQTVFYSWQSDTITKENRNLIQDAIDLSIKKLKKEVTLDISLDRDQDTNGIPGSPQISDIVMAKIAKARIYIADITPINANASHSKLIPNPNVLLELGFAVALLGWDNIILTANTKYGDIHDLPFDLNSRRITKYHYDSQNGLKPAEARNKLSDSIFEAMKCILLQHEHSLISGKFALMWLGDWRYSGPHNSQNGKLEIYDICSNSFRFRLKIWAGSRTGDIDGVSQIISQNRAIAIIKNGNLSGDGELQFNRIKQNGKRQIEIVETKSCQAHCGMGLKFDGNFDPITDLLIENSVVTELEVNKLKMMLGDKYTQFSKNFQGVSAEYRSSLTNTVIAGGVGGFYTIMESILMYNGSGEIWLAYLDSGKIIYATNVLAWKRELPDAIREWQTRFASFEIEYVKY